MSYILDALRKADAERERDPARGIHAHPQPVATPERGLPPALWGVVALVLAVAAAYAFWPRAETKPVVAQAGPAPMPAPLPVPAPVSTATPPAPVTVPPVASAVLPPAPPEAIASPAPVIAAPAQVTASKPVLARAASAAAPASVAAGPADRVFAIAELPADIQRELPKLPISGGVYSDNASQRMLIVNGQVATEGMEISPGLVLEQIRPKAAILRFRGWKYSVAY